MQIILGTWFLPLPNVTLGNAGEIRGVRQQCWGESIPIYSHSVTSSRTADLAVEIVTEEWEKEDVSYAANYTIDGLGHGLLNSIYNQLWIYHRLGCHSNWNQLSKSGWGWQTSTASQGSLVECAGPTVWS